MSELIRWTGGEGISFFVSGDEIRGYDQFGLNASAETEDKTTSGEKYVAAKNAGFYEIQMDVTLVAALGVDVKGVAMAMSEAARKGEKGYFYTGGEKLFPGMFMAVTCKITNIRMAADGTWTQCQVNWTLKQCEKYGGGTTGGSSGGSSSKSTGKSAAQKAVTAAATGAAAGIATALGLTNNAKTAAKNALAKLKNNVPKGAAGTKNLQIIRLLHLKK